MRGGIFRKQSILSAEDPSVVQGGFKPDGMGKYGAHMYAMHRVNLHTGLRELATGEEGEGQPAELHISKPVRSYDAETGWVHLEDGTSHQADLVIAADGVHSHAASYINGGDYPAVPSTAGVCRFLIPTQNILDDPIAAPIMEGGDGHINFIKPKRKDRWFLRYPCRDNTLQNFAMYIDRSVAESDDIWTQHCDKDTLRHAMRGFHPSLLRLCDLAEEELPLWRCAERAPVPSCTKGRLVMIGDSFHTMLPYRGRGFAAAAQDAAVLQILFDGVTNASEADILKRLKAFQSIRLNRAALTQIFSSSKLDEAYEMKEEYLRYMSEEELPTSNNDLQDRFASYDARADPRLAYASL